MHCFVMGFLKWLAIPFPIPCIVKNSRIKANNDLISASLGEVLP